MQRAEAEGREVPEEELRRIVGRAVIEGVMTGYGMGADAAAGAGLEAGEGVGVGEGPAEDAQGAAKRPRTEGGSRQ